jgi:hypothetical protein
MKHNNNYKRISSTRTAIHSRQSYFAQPLRTTLTRQELSHLVAQMVD